MAAYAALLSLMNTLNNVRIHPRISTFFDHPQIQSLNQIINFLLHFMETETSNNFHGINGEALERRIASTAHAAEDVIESHLVHLLLAGETSSNVLLNLETEIEYMKSVQKTVLETMKFEDEQSSPTSSKPLTTTKKNFVVGFEEKLIQIMDKLTGHESDLQIIPIVGMGGIGKTTLAKSVYDNSLIVESFDIRAWVTISQEYSVNNVLFQLLSCIKHRNISISLGADLETEYPQLGLKLYQTLMGRRYLIVLDDMWSLEAWDMIKSFFPSNDDRSRVVITTRITSVATHLSSSFFGMDFLDGDQSWKLFCVNVFLDKGCPNELERIGKKIVRKCKGLPLSIVVIGGLLRNSPSTRECWENIARDLHLILMSRNDDRCFIILSLSYNHLPIHLKPCFLYMGVFEEDVLICVSQLIKIFVAEGFLKPKEGQTSEEVAEDYLNDLVDRNLILVDSWKWNGSIKYFKIHDLVREVCLKIGVREKIFYRMKKLHIPASLNSERRIVFDGKIPEKQDWPKDFLYALPTTSLVRTFLYGGGTLPFKFRMLRVLACAEFVPLEDIVPHVNLRYLDWGPRHGNLYYKLPSSVSLLWNVHTLNFKECFEQMFAPSEIWYMRQFRHIQFYKVVLPNPPPSEEVDVLLPNLQTLSTVVNFSFTKEVCKKIPNVKKLRIEHNSFLGEKKCYYYLDHLHKLQALYCSFGVPKRGDFVRSVVFPTSLRKLSLDKCHFHWEDVNTFGLTLPHLEVLKLFWDAAMGPEWDCVEGAFPSLKFLYIEYVDLIKWTAESSGYFPVLEKLHLYNLEELERIPTGIGEILTLGSLRVHCCSLSAAISSIEILEEQLSLGYEDLQLEVTISCDREDEERFMEKVEVNSFATKNFVFCNLY